jgi:hypothetical protein
MGELVTAVDEPQTIYVLPGDTLLLPGDEHTDVAKLTALDEHFGLRELIVHSGITRPWILRKGHTLPPKPGQTE